MHLEIEGLTNNWYCWVAKSWYSLHTSTKKRLGASLISYAPLIDLGPIMSSLRKVLLGVNGFLDS
jgi:hypothetical protein